MTATATLGAFGEGGATALCPSNTTLTGGGAHNSQRLADLVSSAPNNATAPTGWYAFADSDTLSSNTLTVYALCMPLK
ncbi:hypothetical protein P8605_44980 [Streptomyces sp. T-3]|nr:hypothetical protein [Streptomyces sp. T-3]